MSTFSLSKTFSLGKWVSICTQCTHSQNDVMLMLLNTNDKIAHARAVFYWERKLIFTTYYKNSFVRKCVRFEEYFMRNAHKVSTQQYFSACRMWWKLNCFDRLTVTTICFICKLNTVLEHKSALTKVKKGKRKVNAKSKANINIYIFN